ncbi:MAG TPA: hypothetical protein VKA73_12160 [Rubrobacter sp.]|nr:hypothetical protein [Rubrobacter sp.]
MYPTTTAAHDGRLLAVNSQFDARDEGRRPDLPFTVSDIPVPEDAAPATASATASGGASPVPDTGGVSPGAFVLLAALLAGGGALVVGYTVTKR